MPHIESKLNPRGDDFKANAAAMRALVDDLNARLAQIALGGGDGPRAKHLARGKLLPRDRVAQLLDAGSPFLGAAGTLFWSQLTQTVLLGAWLALRTPQVVLGALREWRMSLFAGLAGASASLANVTALALESASNVRTLILVEVLFTYFVSLRIFREAISRRELAGIALVVLGVGIVVATSR